MYLIFNNPQWMVPPYAYELPISTEGVSNAQVLWTDDDGDGYFFWGLGSKPSSCPYWIPNIPDGDDSDPLKGPLDNYGYTASIGAITTTLTVTDSINYTINHGLNSNVVVANGGVLSITSEVVMANCRIHVENGGTLIIDGGRLLHADIELKPSSRLVVRNGGLIHMKPGFEFFAPKGAIVDLEYGEIS